MFVLQTVNGLIKVIAQFEMGKYTVIQLDNPIPLKKFDMVEIDGIFYIPEIVYDMPQSIGVLGIGKFVGKTVSFI